MILSENLQKDQRSAVLIFIFKNLSITILVKTVKTDGKIVYKLQLKLTMIG